MTPLRSWSINALRRAGHPDNLMDVARVHAHTAAVRVERTNERRVSRVRSWRRGWPRMRLRDWSIRGEDQCHWSRGPRRLSACRRRVCWRYGRLDWSIRGVVSRLVAWLLVVGAVPRLVV